MSLSVWVNGPVRLQFQIYFFFVSTTHLNKMIKTKTFSSDSQPGYVLSLFLKVWFIKKKKKEEEEEEDQF